MPSKSYLEQVNRNLSIQRDDAEETLAKVDHWCSDMLDRHQPYVSRRIDVSISHTKKMRADLLERIGRALFCRECRTPFPCRDIANLRSLRDLLRTSEYAGLPTSERECREGAIEAAI